MAEWELAEIVGSNPTPSTIKNIFLIYSINSRVLVFLLGSLITQSLGFYQEIVGQSPTLATTRNLTAK